MNSATGHSSVAVN